jgi:hypothetical protein
LAVVYVADLTKHERLEAPPGRDWGFVVFGVLLPGLGKKPKARP